FGEVYYYVLLKISQDVMHPVAMVSIYSEPDPWLLIESSYTLYSCVYRGNDNLLVIPVKHITAVVGMVPH
ncbi:hypothetical protein NEOLEDRAFT_1050715, partial [Neolentinus lepideus HHB14362 ss-1]